MKIGQMCDSTPYDLLTIKKGKIFWAHKHKIVHM